MATNITPTGINMASYSQRNLIEDFLKAEYEGVLRDEFNKMEALINRLPKDTITGKKKYKTFRLGISDNVRMLGNSYDNYELAASDFYNSGTERVEAEFDTTKMLATFAITDEAILKGTSDGSIVDVLKESLDSMEMALKTTFQRFTYGTEDGWIGKVSAPIEAFSLGTHAVSGARPKYDAPDSNFYEEDKQTTPGTYDYTVNQASGNRHSIPQVVKFKMTNSTAVLPGMGLILSVETANSKTLALAGKIWQMDNSRMDVNGDATIILFVEKIYDGAGNKPVYEKTTDTALVSGKTYYTAASDTSSAIDDTHDGVNAYTEVASPNVANIGNYYEKKFAGVAAGATAALVADTANTAKTINYINYQLLYANATIKTYARQFAETAALSVNKEYVGLQDIVIDVDKKIYGVDRSVYTSLKSTIVDLQGTDYMGEEYLRDMSDHLATTMPDNTSITLVAAKHRIISAVEKSMYQFKEYSLDTTGNGFTMGRPDIKFDNFVLVKDKFARDQNVYFLDQNKIGELVRRDLQWITSGEVNGVLQRRDGTELYEGIMNKYANTYIDAWRCHAAFVNVAVPGLGTAVGTKYAAISNS